VNCGAIPPELIDSELFGHERGSFTGAVQSRRGWFERADGGTLFLDEVGELLPAAQVRLLRILQEGVFCRVGGQRELRVDVRIVAATNRDLRDRSETQPFREDLWYRLAVFPIQLPPLRDRPEDIPALSRHFALRAARRFGLSVRLPSPSDQRLLLAYPWPGNVRELASVIDRAAILGGGRALEVDRALGVGVNAAPAPSPPGRCFQTLDEAIGEHIKSALRASGGKVEGPAGAARLLGVNPHTLRSRMRRLELDWSAFRS
jgi:transcriptional regulator with GAF, ATPase, and Fis domain